MERSTEASNHAWKLFPFLAGLAAAPILFGAVNPLQQAMVGGLFGLSLLLLVFDSSGISRVPSAAKIGWWLVLALALVLPLVPLPAALVGTISPERLALAKSFPLNPGDPIQFLTLTLSPAATLSRVWEIVLVVVSFFLARQAARLGMNSAFAMALCLALLVLAGSDIWYRFYGHGKLLGIWPDNSRHAAGTFANRNHFADWIFVAVLFLLGWLAQRNLSSAPVRDTDKKPRGFATVVAWVAILAAVVMAVLCGSRGAPVALVAGLLVLAATLSIIVKIRVRLTAARLLGGMAVVATVIYCSGHALDRFASGHDLSFKKLIWRDCWRIIRAFPLFGTGPGTFDVAFALYKTGNGDKLILFAENEYLQSLVENGVLTTALFFGLVAASLISLFRYARRARSPLAFGAFAALIAFLVHCYVEFVFEVEATALLAAAIFGWLHGLRDRDEEPAILPPPSAMTVIGRLVFAATLLSACAVCAYAWEFGNAATHAKSGTQQAADYAASLKLWPGAYDRDHKFERLTTWKDAERRAGVAIAPAVNEEISRELRLDSLNMSLRVENFFSHMVEFPADRFDEAWRIIHLNPTAPGTPLHFAHQFAKEGELDLPFLRAAAEYPDNLIEVYDLAWSIEPGGDLLWKVTPNTDAAMQALGTFALGKSMWPAALLAFQRISDKVSPEKRADNFLNAHRPDLALELLSGHSLIVDYFRGRAFLALGKSAEAIRSAESVWNHEKYKWEIDPPLSKSIPAELESANAIFEKAPEARDLTALLKLADTSGLPRIRWMIFETQRRLGTLDAAAKTAVVLAGQLLGDEGKV